jgi:hypothetical protein
MSNQASLPAESPEEVARLREDLIAFYRPINSQERFAVERIALAQQSILRAARLETNLFANPPDKELRSILETEGFKFFLRYQAQAERAYRRAVDELMLLRAQRPLRPVAPQPAAPSPKPQLVATAAASAPSSPPSRPAAASPVVAPARSAAASRNGAENLALRL